MRGDFSSEPFFTNTKYPWYIDYDDKQWNYDDKVSGYGYHAYLEVGEKFSTDTPQVITREDWEAAIAAKNAPASPSEAQQGHVHAEIMAEYALVAKTNPEPWKEFEVLNSEVKGWEELDTSPRWFEDAQYRRKPTPPKTTNIGGVIVEAWPLEKAEIWGNYFEVLQHYGEFMINKLEPWKWAEGTFYDRVLKAGYVFATEEQAQAVADALNLVYNRAIGKVEE